MKFSKKTLTIMALLLVIVSVSALFAGCQSENPTTAKPTDGASIPSTSPDVDDPTEPTDPDVDPTDPDVDPTDPDVDPTDPEVEPTDPEVEPTDPDVDPTDPDVDPTDPEVEPTDPEVEPTDPDVDPPENEDVWGVCGLFTNWGQNGEADYVLVLDPDTGLLTTEEALTLNAGDEFRVRKNGSWDVAYPENNYVVAEDGAYYITFDPETHTVDLVGREFPPEIEPVSFTDAQKGTYLCKNDAWDMDCKLTIHEDNTLSLTDELQGWNASGVSVTSDENGYYLFEYTIDEDDVAHQASFRFIRGLIYLYLQDGDFYMIKPTEGLTFSGDQVGTFVGKDDAGDADYTLTVHENGTVSYAYSISISDYGFTIGASDEDLAVSEYEGKYYFLYEDMQSGAVLAAFAFAEDGSVLLEDTFDEDGEPLNMATLHVQEEEVIWGVCGSFTNWGQNGEADYVLVLDPETGLLTTEEALTLNAGDKFKVRKNGVWGEEYPESDYVVTEDGKYFITFDPETHEVALVAVVEPAAGFTAEQIGKYEYSSGWAGADKRSMTLNDNGTISYNGSEELTVTYEDGVYYFTYNDIAYSFTFTSYPSQYGGSTSIGIVLDISNEPGVVVDPDLEEGEGTTITLWKLRSVI